jgi:outer membrane protein
VILEVVRTFVDVRRAEEEISIRETNVASLQKQVEAASDRFRVGEVTRTDVAQAEARAAGSLAELAAARARLATARAQYEAVVGRVPVQLAAPPPPPGAPANLQEAVTEAMSRSPEVSAARAAETAASEQVGVARGQYRPRFGWSANAGLQESYQDRTFRDTNVGASLELTVPIYQGGLLASRTREAELAANRARYDRLSAERGVTAQVTSAWHSLIAAREAAAASESRVAAARIALDGAEQELAVGTRTTLDVLDQERELLDARVNLNDAQRNAYVAAHQLLGAIGRLTPEAFGR